MEYVQKAIELAIEGGYIPKQYLKASQAVQDDWKKKGLVMKEQALLEPLFWQSLGKTKKWGFKDRFFCKNKDCNQCNDKNNSWPSRGYCRYCGVMQSQYTEDTGNPNWKYYWHNFIDHLASGKPANDFFKTLLE